jgi:hypothetical protein
VDRRLPTFLIVGTAKAGTTSLYEYLRPHPQVFMAQPKELDFFSFDRRWAWGPDWYERHFRRARGAIAIGEASPSYTQVRRREVALARIGEMLPDVRLIFLARLPITRARSSYLQVVAEGRERRPIDQVLVEHSEFVDQSRYWAAVQDLLRVVDRERLLVLGSERLRDDPAATLAQVHRFIGVEDRTDPVFETRFNRAADRGRVKRAAIMRFSELRPVVRLGESMPEWTKPALRLLTRRRATPVHAEIHQVHAERLIDYLRNDIRAFGRYLGEDLSDWEVWPPRSGSA